MIIKSVLAADSLQDIYSPGAALGGSGAKLSNLLNPLINNVLILSGIMAFAVILISGFNYISASGDKAKIEQAQQMLNYGIIGLVLVVAAFLITRVFGSVIGITFF